MKRQLYILATLFILLGVAGCASLPLAGRPQPARYGMVIRLKPEKIEEYKRLHAKVWPGIMKKITACNIRNYSIYLRQLDDGNHYLFSYFEYVGTDFSGDMTKMADDPLTQQWWKLTDPCQEPVKNHKEKEWWTPMEEVFHQP